MLYYRWKGNFYNKHDYDYKIKKIVAFTPLSLVILSAKYFISPIIINVMASIRVFAHTILIWVFRMLLIIGLKEIQ